MKRTEDQAKSLARRNIERKLSKVGANELRKREDFFSGAGQALLTAHEHLVREIDAQDAMLVATQRHEQPSRAAAQLDDRLLTKRALFIDGSHVRRELPIPRDVVASALKVVIVQLGIAIVVTGSESER